MRKDSYTAFLKTFTARIRQDQWPHADDGKAQFMRDGDLWHLSWMGHLSSMEAALFHETGDEDYLARSREVILYLCDMQQEMITRIAQGESLALFEKQIADGMGDNAAHLPVLEGMFSFAPVMKALMLLTRERFSDAEWERVERLCYAEIRPIFFDCEWGRHNRCALRAVALLLFSLLFPEHADADRAQALSRHLISDSLGSWSIEDATSYLGIWVTCVAEYAYYGGIWNFRIEQVLHYYARFFTSLLLPSGGLPEFGDTRFDSGTSSMLVLSIMEMMAAKRRDGILKWAVERQFTHMVEDSTQDNYAQLERGLTDAYLWADDSVPVQAPDVLTCEALDEAIGKKVVFRDSWERDGLYLFYNYRDVNRFGKLTRDYLQNTIPVHAEKPHHGHADEQAINALCANGAVLLRDGGYRDRFTTNGHYRADFYHNRLVLRNGRMLREPGFLAYAEDIGDYLPVETEKIYLQEFSFAWALRTRLYDRFRRADCDRHILYLKDEAAFLVVDTVRAWGQQPLTSGVMYHAERIAGLGGGMFRVMEETYEGITHFADFKPPRREHAESSLLIAFADPQHTRFSIEPLRRNYRQELALSQYISRYYRPGECYSHVSLLVPETGQTQQEIERSRERAQRMAGSLRVTSLLGGQCLAVKLAGDHHAYCVGIRCDDQYGIEDQNLRPTYSYACGQAAYGSFVTDARLLMSNGERYGFVDGTRVDYQQETLFSAHDNACNQLDFQTVLRRPGTWGNYEAQLKTK